MPLEVRVKFIVHTGDRKDRRKEELLLSDARSHASRISHRESKWRRLKAFLHNSAREQTLAGVLPHQTDIDDARSGKVSPTASSASTAPIELSHGPSPQLFGTTADTPSDPDENALQMTILPTWESPWHWSKGARVDPFNCIPWVTEAPGEFDLRKELLRPQWTCSKMLTYPSQSHNSASP